MKLLQRRSSKKVAAQSTDAWVIVPNEIQTTATESLSTDRREAPGTTVSIPPPLSQASSTTPLSSTSSSSTRTSVSLGRGSFTDKGGVEDFASVAQAAAAWEDDDDDDEEEVSTPRGGIEPNSSSNQQHHVLPSPSKLLATIKTSSDRVLQNVFHRKFSSFLRVADLHMEMMEETDAEQTLSLHSVASSFDTTASDTNIANYHHVSVDPPPGVDTDPKERWIALDDGKGGVSPVAPRAVQALSRKGLRCTLNRKMWTPADSKTTRFIKQHPEAGWHQSTWQASGSVLLPLDNESPSPVDLDQVLVWSGSFPDGHYGSDLPAVRAAGFLNTSPDALMELLVDSARVKEYNKLSLGRTDVLVLQNEMNNDNDISGGGAFGGVCKVMKSESRPPMLRKTMEFVSVLHATELDDGSGYLLVTRAVTTPPEENAHLAPPTLKSEILMGVNLLKRVHGHPDRCLMISVNHIRSPMVPMMIAKRIGLQAAMNFIHDLRAACSS